MYLFILNVVRYTDNIYTYSVQVDQNLIPTIKVLGDLKTEITHLIEGYSTVIFDNSKSTSDEKFVTEEYKQISQNKNDILYLLRMLKSLDDDRELKDVISKFENIFEEISKS